MHAVSIDELTVQFPFEPYEVQKQLMTRVVECCRLRACGLLESPTGTGKTLSLLCASIAWQRKQRSHLSQLAMSNLHEPGIMRPEKMFKGRGNSSGQPPGLNVPKIIYSSRTHSQLSQAIQELKRSFYKDTRAVVLGSRDLMCVHEEVSRLESSSAKIMACHVRMHAHRCGYYNNVNSMRDEPTIRGQTVVDIEDIVKKGKAQRFCPFFMSRELVGDADVVFMPYNYLLDPKLRATHGIDLKNAVIILDEGHNIARICEEAVSFEIKSSTIAQCCHEVTKTLNEYSEMSQKLSNNALTKDLSLPNLINLKKSFLQLEEELDKIQTTSEGTLLPGSDLLRLLFQNGFPPSFLPRIIQDLDSISSFLSESHFETTGCDKFSSVLRVLASQSMMRNPAKFGDSYKVFVQFEESKRSKDKLMERTSQHAKVFNFWCFSPALGLETLMLQGPRCVLLASGTLSPMSFLAKELNMDFAVQHTNPHIIKDNQLYATVVTRGPGGVRLSSSFQNRDNVDYLRSLGELIRVTCSIVPKGVLVFFPSYSVMELCKRNWENTGMWEKMGENKKLLFEPKGKDAFKTAMDDYYTTVQGTTGGACLMAVCRGKVSEGLDFTDDNGRAVIITGIPYAPSKDPQVMAKQQYLNNKVASGERDSVNGGTWYQLEATRALNQAIGRIIRHANDFGAILLCDERIAESRFKLNLSGWVAERLKVSTSFDKTSQELAEFFGSSVQKERAAQAKYFMTTVKRPKARVHRPIEQEVIPLSDESITRQLDMDSTFDEVTEESFESKVKVRTMVGKGRSTNSSIGGGGSSSSSSIRSKSDTLSTSSLFRNLVSPNIQKNGTSSLFGNLVSSNVTSKVDFTAAVPVYPKPFVAYSKSPTSSLSGQEQKRKRLKLSAKNSTFASITESTAANTNNPFSDVTAFWTWVKTVLEGPQQPKFVKAMKTYKADKNLQALYQKVKDIFPVEHYNMCIHGLSLVVTPDDVNKLKELLRINSLQQNVS